MYPSTVLKKCVLCTLLLLPVAGIGHSQQAVPPTPPAAEAAKTKLEAFQAKTGIVIIRGFSKVGTLSGLYGTHATIESREYTDASTGRKEYGMTIEIKEGGRLERENTSYIDYDEIDSLVKGIEYISKIDNKATKMDSFQADYRTKGDLVISTFNNDKNEVLMSVKSGRIGAATAFFNLSSLNDLKKLVEDAKSKIDTVKQAK